VSETRQAGRQAGSTAGLRYSLRAEARVGGRHSLSVLALPHGAEHARNVPFLASMCMHTQKHSGLSAAPWSTYCQTWLRDCMHAYVDVHALAGWQAYIHA
jgi:hypothetical protein